MDGFSPRWKWFSLLDKLAMGDITRYEEVTCLNFLSCLNKLSYDKERQDYLNELEKRRNKNKNI